MTTRKTLIVAKYTVLELELKKHLDNSLFPSLDTVDLVDIVYYITLIFAGIESDKGYREKIRELITTDNINVDATKFDIIAPLIIEFIDWLKKL